MLTDDLVEGARPRGLRIGVRDQFVPTFVMGRLIGPMTTTRSAGFPGRRRSISVSAVAHAGGRNAASPACAWMIRTICAGLALLLFTAAVQAAKIQADKDDLRKLASLPPMSFTIALGTVRGRLRWQQELGAPEEIDRLQKNLRSDSSDVPRLLQLARLLEQAGRTNQAALTYSNAIAALRQQIQSRPKDGRRLSELGEALASTSQDVEAESVLRRAVTIAPQDPECWTELGLFLNDNSRAALYPTPAPAELRESPALLVTKYRPSPEQFERADRLAREAMECFDRVISLAPKDGASFERHGCGVLSVASLRTLRQQMSAPDLRQLILALSPFNPECLPDFRRAADLSPEDPSLVAAVAFAEALGAVMSRSIKQNGSPHTPDKPWDALTVDQAKSVQERMRQLTALAEGPAKEKAARAAMFLGLLQSVIMDDELGAEARLRSAVTLNPRDPQAWQALIVSLSKDDHYEKMIEAGEAFVKAIDSPRSHLCLAKAHEKLNHWGKVLEQAQAAMQAVPDNLTAKLAVTAALIRVNDKNLPQPSSVLLETGNEDFKQADGALRAHALFLCGLVLALDDNAEQARPLLQQALRLQPNHEGAKQALAIIESWR